MLGRSTKRLKDNSMNSKGTSVVYISIAVMKKILISCKNERKKTKLNFNTSSLFFDFHKCKITCLLLLKMLISTSSHQVAGSILSQKPWSCIFCNWSQLGRKIYIFLIFEFTTPCFNSYTFIYWWRVWIPNIIFNQPRAIVAHVNSLWAPSPSWTWLFQYFPPHLL